MFLGNDTITIKTKDGDLTIDGCKVTDDGKVLAPHPMDDKQLLIVLGDGRRLISRDVVAWHNAAGEFDHAEGQFEEVTDDDGSPDRDQ